MPIRFLALVLCLLPFAAAADLLDAITQPQEYEARRASSSNEDITRNGDARGIPRGETLVIMEEEGPGVVTHFWNTIGSTDPFQGRSLTG